MDKSLDNHRKELIRQAIELWDEKGDLKDVEKDPVVRLLFSALAYQSHSVAQEIAAFQEMTVNEFRNKLIPYYLIKPFPAYAIVQTKIKENIKERVAPMSTFIADEKCSFEFGKAKIPFAPLFSTKILNATIASQRISQDNSLIEVTLNSKETVEDFSGVSFYLEGINENQDVEITMNNQPLPVVKPNDYHNMPFTEWFQNHFLLAEENQLQFGRHDYWVELFVKHQVQLFYIGEYDVNKIYNRSLSPVFNINFKNKSPHENLRHCTVKINCLPIVNVQKNTVYLTDAEPIKKLATDKSAFLSLLYDRNIGDNTKNYIIRHYGIERYSQKELLFQLNDLFNRFVSDYYAFKDIDELKKGEKLETIYRTFKELLPVVKKDNDDVHSSVYAILKLDDTLNRSGESVKIDFITTHCEQANKIKKGEKPLGMTDFLDKENTVLLVDTSGGRNEERNEESVNHLARYNLLTKDKLVTASDLKAFCYRELQNRIRTVSVQNTGEQIAITIQLKEEYTPEDLSEITYYEQTLQQKIDVRSLLCIPVIVTIMN